MSNPEEGIDAEDSIGQARSVSETQLRSLLAVVLNVRRTNTPEFMRLLRDSLESVIARLEPGAHVVLGVGSDRLFVSRPASENYEDQLKESA